MDLNRAMNTHVEWKMKLRSAITGKERVDAASLSRDNCCEFGRWLHGEGRALHGRLASYQECVGAHANFHREAGRVAELINAKKYTEAESALAGVSPYSTASNLTGVAIARLKREASI